MQQFPSELPFASLMQYSVSGTESMSQHSRVIRSAVKGDKFVADGLGGKVRAIQLAAQRLEEHLASSVRLQEWFQPDALLVPMPGHSPRLEHSLWVPLEICKLIVERRITAGYLPLLERRHRVAKSAFAEKGQRPSAQDHCESMQVHQSLLIDSPPRITIIDDFITRGATSLGAYVRLKQRLPATDVKVFSLVRAVSPGEVQVIVEPVVGTITLEGDRIRRRP